MHSFKAPSKCNALSSADFRKIDPDMWKFAYEEHKEKKSTFNKLRSPVKHGKRKGTLRAFMNQIGKSSGGSKLIKARPEDFTDPSIFEVCELEALALECKGLVETKGIKREESNKLEAKGGERELDDDEKSYL
nr:heat shock factor (HSF)-type, DNA-binding [Tanacetum cinerariifolium]